MTAASGPAIGIDVGGTKTLGVVVDLERGRVVDRLRIDTEASLGGAHVLARAAALAIDLRDRHRAVRDAPIGVALCELVDPLGVPSSAVTVDWLGLDVAAAFGDRVVVESDVRAAATAEARIGAGAGAHEVLYVTVGTGIAHTLVVGGEPYRGHRGAALLVGAPPVEREASGPAIAARAGLPDAESAFADPAAAAVIADAARRLGLALAALSAALDPQLIVIGGGLGLRDDYRDAAVAVMQEALADAGAHPVEVRPAALGDASAAIGAAVVADRR